MTHETFEQRMERACRDREIPGAVLVGGDSQGKFRYEKVFGYRSLKDPSKPDPMPLDATMWLASCTKLIGTVAAMQCVERGQLKLDDDISTVLPELKELEILTGFEQGPDGKDKPILVKNTKPITLRQLLTHSSGLGYDVFNPVLKRFRATEGFTTNLAIVKPLQWALTYPLLFPPGESWEYGVGIDWAAWAVERVSNIPLQDYIQKNIWDPLGMKSMTFQPKTKLACMDKLADMSIRAGGIDPIFGIAADPEGKVEYIDDRVWNLETRGISAGAGAFGNIGDYQKLLQSICANDKKLLKRSTVEEMFKPQLSEASQKALLEKLTIPQVNQALSGFPMGTQVDYGLGGMLILEDLPAARRKGTMSWGGYPNLLWFCDRKAGVSGIYGSQIYLPGDLKTQELFGKWEKELYNKVEKEKL